MSHKYDSDGNMLKHDRKRAQAGDEKPHLPQLAYTQIPVSERNMIEVARMFLYFVHRDDGYLKVKRQSDESVVHLTWTWTLGQWSKHYVYSRVEYYDVAYGLELLEQKINAVIEGHSKPTPDRGYNWTDRR